MAIESYRVYEGVELEPDTPKHSNGRPTAYVSARFTVADQTCTIYLRWLKDPTTSDPPSVRDGRSDSRTLTATAERDGSDGASGNYVAVDEPFDLPCRYYEIVVETPPDEGDVSFVVREMGP